MKILGIIFAVIICVAMFIKIYVPLMHEEQLNGKAERAIINRPPLSSLQNK